MLSFRLILQISTVLALATLAGCSGGNLQFSGEVQPLPANYRTAALAAIEGRPRAGGELLISRPQTVVGQNVFSPRRWYVCVRGLKPPRAPVVGPDLLWPAVTRALGAPPPADIYDAIVFLPAGREPWVIDAFDAELCRDVAFDLLRPAA